MEPRHENPPPPMTSLNPPRDIPRAAVTGAIGLAVVILLLLLGFLLNRSLNEPRSVRDELQLDALADAARAAGRAKTAKLIQVFLEGEKKKVQGVGERNRRLWKIITGDIDGFLASDSPDNHRFAAAASRKLAIHFLGDLSRGSVETADLRRLLWCSKRLLPGGSRPDVTEIELPEIIRISGVERITAPDGQPMISITVLEKTGGKTTLPRVFDFSISEDTVGQLLSAQEKNDKQAFGNRKNAGAVKFQ